MRINSQTSTLQKPCGITDTSPIDGTSIYLPLEQLQVHAEIVDVSATVTLTQTFWQYSPLSTSRATYVFPVPARAAVCAFEMHTEDGRSIKAVAKEKEQARREHERAIRHGRMTGLVEHTTDDIFTISLGSLPSLQMITTKLTYVLDLMDNDLPDQVRLQLPVCIGMRFGTLPEGMVQAKTIPSERISITTEVYMKGAIQSITSPSHSTLTLLPDGDTHKTTSVPSRVAEYRSPTFLSQDFILAIQAEGLDAPRCFAQRGPDGSVAMQLTVVPKFNLPTVSAQEYIFVVDRSCSMAGARIEQAKRALVMLLRALPRQGTVFNIFSFGYRCDSLWGESRIYNAETLETATFHIDRMNANYGGTSIRSALEKVLSSSDTQLPTACFVLTDGEAYDIDATIDVVTKAAAGAQTGSPLRVFTLGIGETTSSAMCEGIARAGNGVCLMAAASESIIAKCSKLVWASRTGILENVSVDWGVPQSALDSNSADDTQTTVLRQGPSKVSSIYTANRFVVLAIVESGTFDIPKEVVLRAQRHSGEIFTFAVPVEVLSNTAQEPQRPLIHTLAARRIIMDLEDIKRGHVSSETKALIIHLGERYQLASRYTSFIAVEGPDQEKLLPVDEESIKAKSDPVQAVESSVDEQEHARRSRSPTRITRTGGPRPARRIVMTDRHSRSRSPIFVESRQSEGSVSPTRTVRTDTSRSRSPCIIIRSGFESRSRSPIRIARTGNRSRSRSPILISRQSEGGVSPIRTVRTDTSRSRSPCIIIRSGFESRSRSPIQIARTGNRSRSRSPILISRQSEGGVSPIRTVRTDTSRSRSPRIIIRSVERRSRSPIRIARTGNRSRSRSPILISRQSEGGVSPTHIVRTDTSQRSRSRSPRIIIQSGSERCSRSPMRMRSRSPIVVESHARDRPRSRFVELGSSRCTRALSRSPSRTADIPPQSVDDEVVRLVRLQSFDGSFPADKQLANIVGQEALDEAEKLCVDPVIWATVLAIAYLQKNLAQQPHLLEGLLEKANEFVQQSPDLDFKALLEKANSLLN